MSSPKIYLRLADWQRTSTSEALRRVWRRKSFLRWLSFGVTVLLVIGIFIALQSCAMRVEQPKPTIDPRYREVSEALGVRYEVMTVICVDNRIVETITLDVLPASQKAWRK